MSESDKIKTFFKRALGVVSTFKDTPWYDEINGRQRNIIEAKDINIEKTPELPEWSDSSLNSSTMATLGFDLDGDDFASSNSSFTDLHLYNSTSTSGTYTVVGERLPGMYLDESVIDSSGVVALFVRLKLDKMEGDENLDPSAIAYTKIRRNEEKISSPSVKWRGSYLSLIDTTTQITYSNGNDVGKYADTLSRYIDFSTAVAIFELNTDNSNKVILEQETEVFMLRRAAWSDVSTDGWTLIDTDNASIGYFIQGVESNDMQLFRRVYQPGTYYFDNNSALYIFQRLYTTSIMDNAYEFSYKTQTNVGGSIDVFKPYNYTLEYFKDDSTFVTVANNIGNWTFDTNSGTILFEHDPSLDDVNIDLSNGDLYFTFTKYVGLQGLENLVYYKDGKIGIGTKNPQYELDVSGSTRIGGDLDVDDDLTIGTTVLYVDSASSRVGINNTTPRVDLDITGDVIIRDTVTVNGNTVGKGLCPIGTIIMWPTSTFASSYGVWALCDGNSDKYLTSVYTGLAGLLTTTANGQYWILPDYEDRYIRGASSGSIATNSGNNYVDFTITSDQLPEHTHTVSAHNHTVDHGAGHDHGIVKHSHNINATNSKMSHTHELGNHTHGFTNSKLQHSHTVSSNHTHNFSSAQLSQKHTHSINDHDHGYTHDHFHKSQRVHGLDINYENGEKKNATIHSEIQVSSNAAAYNDTTTHVKYHSNSVDQTSSSINTNTHFNIDSHTSLDSKNESINTKTITDGDDSAITAVTSTVNLDNNYPTSTTNNSSAWPYTSTDPSVQTGGLTLATNTSGTDPPNSVTVNIEPSYHTIFFFIRVA